MLFFAMSFCTALSCLVFLSLHSPSAMETTNISVDQIESGTGVPYYTIYQDMASHLDSFLTPYLLCSPATFWTTSLGLVVIVFIVALYRKLSLPIDRTKLLGEVGYIPYSGLTMKEMAALVKRQRMNGDVPPVYPNGWFAVLESRDLAAGQAKAVSCLGLHLAVFRGEDGRAHVIDAYCPHLGANLAVGGKVKGSCLECPFHGWVFNGDDGKCTHIPYADKIPEQAAVKSYISLERNNFIYMWYDAEKREPTWEPEALEQIESGEIVYGGRSEHIVNAHTEEIPENAADVYHLHQLHSPFVTAGTDLRNMSQYCGSIIKHVWGGMWTAGEGHEKHIGFLDLSHHTTIFGYKMPFFDFKVYVKQMGPGVVTLSFDGAPITLHFVQSVTPLEPMVQRVIHHVYISRITPGILGNLALWAEASQVERDLMIWNNKRYVARPVFVKSKEDTLISRHRRWYSQFYSENSPRLCQDNTGQLSQTMRDKTTDNSKEHKIEE